MKPSKDITILEATLFSIPTFFIFWWKGLEKLEVIDKN